jgi:Cof subfamily protein (haloacid dehalogenase superfamily)
MYPPVRLAAIDMDGTLLPSFGYELSRRNLAALRSAQQAGITVAIATGRRAAFTAPLLEGLGLRADMPLITSNGAVTRTLGGEALDRWILDVEVARGLCGLLRGFGVLVFTFDQPGRGELVIEDLNRAEGRMQLWVEANRDAIEVVRPLEQVFTSRGAPIQGMVAGPVIAMRAAEKAFHASDMVSACECLRTEYPSRDLAILDLLPRGICKGAALERLAGRLGVSRIETLAIGDNWNDVAMLEWAGQSFLMGNAARELRVMAKVRGWKQVPSNDRNGVAVVLEGVIARLPRPAAAQEPDWEEDRA